MNNTTDRIVTVSEAFAIFRRFWALILAAVIACSALGFLYAYSKREVYYEASSVVIVQMATVDEYVGPEANDITRARAIAKSLMEQMSNDNLIAGIRRYFAERRVDSPSENWEDLSVEAVVDSTLKNMLSAYAEESSQHLTITAKAPTPSLAVHMANAAAGEMQAAVVASVGNCTIKPVSTATAAARQSTFSERPIILATIFSAVLSYVGLFVYTIVNPHIQNREELEGNYAEKYTILGTLPGKRTRKRGEKA